MDRNATGFTLFLVHPTNPSINSKSAVEQRMPASMPHVLQEIKDISYTLDIIGDRVHTSKCRIPKCNASTTVRCPAVRYSVI